MRCVFGPVSSRRLGLSLGLDLIPHKTCSYDCIYCELGRTTHKTVQRREYVPKDQILKQLWHRLKTSDTKPDYITLCGSGEPTLNSKIGEVIREIKRKTSIPVAILTNGSLLFMKDVRRDIMEADIVLPSLDAVTKATFQVTNRPHRSLDIEDVIKGMVDFRQEFEEKIWLEVVLLRGVNDEISEIDRMKAIIERIKPDKVQLNTVVRPPAEDYATPLTPNQLNKIKGILGVKAEIIADFTKTKKFQPSANLEADILSIIKRRPCTAEDISNSLGVPGVEIAYAMERLIKDGKAKYKVFNRKGFYSSA